MTSDFDMLSELQYYSTQPNCLQTLKDRIYAHQVAGCGLIEKLTKGKVTYEKYITGGKYKTKDGVTHQMTEDIDDRAHGQRGWSRSRFLDKCHSCIDHDDKYHLRCFNAKFNKESDMLIAACKQYKRD